jgi:hypothetical protein
MSFTRVGALLACGRRLGLVLLAVPALALGCQTFHLHPLNKARTTTQGEPAPVEPAAAAGPRPRKYSFRIAPYVFLSDFEIPRDQPLFRELALLRDQVYKELRLPPGNAVVMVYLFETQALYDRFMKENYPKLPPRRAYFLVQPRPGGPDDLLVYTYWGDRIRRDLRHELTHALLHSVIPYVPLWLDEGLAEYFELPPEDQGINALHVQEMQSALGGTYRLDLARLERLTKVEDMNRPEYREAWAWVHLMLRGQPEARAVLLSYVHQLRNARHPLSPDQPPPPDWQLRPKLRTALRLPEEELRRHLNRLESALRTVQQAGR